MVRIDVEQMRLRRQQLGWTAEELAARSGLDARTVRRMEQGAPARLHSAHAVARALATDTSTFLVNDGSPVMADVRSPAAEQDDDKRTLAAAFKASEHTFQTDLTCEGDQSFREVMYVASLLLTRALAMEGKELAGQEDAGVHEIVAAFKAADVAIRTTLSGSGELGMDEATCVLSLLLARYAIAFNRRPEHGVLTGFNMIRAAADQAGKALSDPIPGHPSLGEMIAIDQLASSVLDTTKEEYGAWVRPGMHLWSGPKTDIVATPTFRPDLVPRVVPKAAQEEKSDKDPDESDVEKSKGKP